MNGYIELKIETGGGTVNGDPIPVNISWGVPIPCLIVQNSRGDLLMYEDGKYTPSSYEITVDNVTFLPCDFRLTDIRGRDMGEHTVLAENINYLDGVQKTKIMI